VTPGHRLRAAIYPPTPGAPGHTGGGPLAPLQIARGLAIALKQPTTYSSRVIPLGSAIAHEQSPIRSRRVRPPANPAGPDPWSAIAPGQPNLSVRQPPSASTKRLTTPGRQTAIALGKPTSGRLPPPAVSARPAKPDSRGVIKLELACPSVSFNHLATKPVVGPRTPPVRTSNESPWTPPDRPLPPRPPPLEARGKPPGEP
jgi:hypothetical protein